MKITWQAEDGYIGPSRPHTVEVDDADLEECENDDERAEIIDTAVQDDFERTVYPVYKNPFQ